jgi:hypothetical protein
MSMPKEIDNFFNRFGKASSGIELPASNSFEQNVVALADYYDAIIKPGKGFFFDFKNTPEYEKPVLDYLTKGYGWILEKPFFIRKHK